MEQLLQKSYANNKEIVEEIKEMEKKVVTLLVNTMDSVSLQQHNVNAVEHESGIFSGLLEDASSAIHEINDKDVSHLLKELTTLQSGLLEKKNSLKTIFESCSQFLLPVRDIQFCQQNLNNLFAAHECVDVQLSKRLTFLKQIHMDLLKIKEDLASHCEWINEAASIFSVNLMSIADESKMFEQMKCKELYQKELGERDKAVSNIFKQVDTLKQFCSLEFLSEIEKLKDSWFKLVEMSKAQDLNFENAMDEEDGYYGKVEGFVEWIANVSEQIIGEDVEASKHHLLIDEIEAKEVEFRDIVSTGRMIFDQQKEERRSSLDNHVDQLGLEWKGLIEQAEQKENSIAKQRNITPRKISANPQMVVNLDLEEPIIKSVTPELQSSVDSVEKKSMSNETFIEKCWETLIEHETMVSKFNHMNLKDQIEELDLCLKRLDSLNTVVSEHSKKPEERVDEVEDCNKAGSLETLKLNITTNLQNTSSIKEKVSSTLSKKEIIQNKCRRQLKQQILSIEEFVLEVENPDTEHTIDILYQNEFSLEEVNKTLISISSEANCLDLPGEDYNELTECISEIETIYYEKKSHLDNVKLIVKVEKQLKGIELLINCQEKEMESLRECMGNITERLNSMFKLEEEIKVCLLLLNDLEPSFYPYIVEVLKEKITLILPNLQKSIQDLYETQTQLIADLGVYDDCTRSVEDYLDDLLMTEEYLQREIRLSTCLQNSKIILQTSSNALELHRDKLGEIVADGKLNMERLPDKEKKTLKGCLECCINQTHKLEDDVIKYDLDVNNMITTIDSVEHSLQPVFVWISKTKLLLNSSKYPNFDMLEKELMLHIQIVSSIKTESLTLFDVLPDNDRDELKQVFDDLNVSFDEITSLIKSINKEGIHNYVTNDEIMNTINNGEIVVAFEEELVSKDGLLSCLRNCIMRTKGLSVQIGSLQKLPSSDRSIPVNIASTELAKLKETAMSLTLAFDEHSGILENSEFEKVHDDLTGLLRQQAEMQLILNEIQAVCQKVEMKARDDCLNLLISDCCKFFIDVNVEVARISTNCPISAEQLRQIKSICFDVETKRKSVFLKLNEFNEEVDKIKIDTLTCFWIQNEKSIVNSYQEISELFLSYCDYLQTTENLLQEFVSLSQDVNIESFSERIEALELKLESLNKESHEYKKKWPALDYSDITAAFEKLYSIKHEISEIIRKLDNHNLEKYIMSLKGIDNDINLMMAELHPASLQNVDLVITKLHEAEEKVLGYIQDIVNVDQDVNSLSIKGELFVEHLSQSKVIAFKAQKVINEMLQRATDVDSVKRKADCCVVEITCTLEDVKKLLQQSMNEETGEEKLSKSQTLLDDINKKFHLISELQQQLHKLLLHDGNDNTFYDDRVDVEMLKFVALKEQYEEIKKVMLLFNATMAQLGSIQVELNDIDRKIDNNDCIDVTLAMQQINSYTHFDWRITKALNSKQLVSLKEKRTEIENLQERILKKFEDDNKSKYSGEDAGNNVKEIHAALTKHFPLVLELQRQIEKSYESLEEGIKDNESLNSIFGKYQTNFKQICNDYEMCADQHQGDIQSLIQDTQKEHLKLRKLIDDKAESLNHMQDLKFDAELIIGSANDSITKLEKQMVELAALETIDEYNAFLVILSENVKSSVRNLRSFQSVNLSQLPSMDRQHLEVLILSASQQITDITTTITEECQKGEKGSTQKNIISDECRDILSDIMTLKTSLERMKDFSHVNTIEILAGISSDVCKLYTRITHVDNVDMDDLLPGDLRGILKLKAQCKHDFETLNDDLHSLEKEDEHNNRIDSDIAMEEKPRQSVEGEEKPRQSVEEEEKPRQSVEEKENMVIIVPEQLISPEIKYDEKVSMKPLLNQNEQLVELQHNDEISYYTVEKDNDFVERIKDNDDIQNIVTFDSNKDEEQHLEIDLTVQTDEKPTNFASVSENACHVNKQVVLEDANLEVRLKDDIIIPEIVLIFNEDTDVSELQELNTESRREVRKIINSCNDSYVFLETELQSLNEMSIIEQLWKLNQLKKDKETVDDIIKHYKKDSCQSITKGLVEANSNSLALDLLLTQTEDVLQTQIKRKEFHGNQLDSALYQLDIIEKESSEPMMASLTDQICCVKGFISRLSTIDEIIANSFEEGGIGFILPQVDQDHLSRQFMMFDSRYMELSQIVNNQLKFLEQKAELRDCFQKDFEALNNRLNYLKETYNSGQSLQYQIVTVTSDELSDLELSASRFIGVLQEKERIQIGNDLNEMRNALLQLQNDLQQNEGECTNQKQVIPFEISRNVATTTESFDHENYSYPDTSDVLCSTDISDGPACTSSPLSYQQPMYTDESLPVDHKNASSANKSMQISEIPIKEKRRFESNDEIQQQHPVTDQIDQLNGNTTVLSSVSDKNNISCDSVDHESTIESTIDTLEVSLTDVSNEDSIGITPTSDGFIREDVLNENGLNQVAKDNNVLLLDRVVDTSYNDLSFSDGVMEISLRDDNSDNCVKINSESVSNVTTVLETKSLILEKLEQAVVKLNDYETLVSRYQDLKTIEEVIEAFCNLQFTEVQKDLTTCQVLIVSLNDVLSVNESEDLMDETLTLQTCINEANEDVMKRKFDLQKLQILHTDYEEELTKLSEQLTLFREQNMSDSAKSSLMEISKQIHEDKEYLLSLDKKLGMISDSRLEIEDKLPNTLKEELEQMECEYREELTATLCALVKEEKYVHTITRSKQSMLQSIFKLLTSLEKLQVQLKGHLEAGINSMDVDSTKIIVKEFKKLEQNWFLKKTSIQSVLKKFPKDDIMEIQGYKNHLDLDFSKLENELKGLTVEKTFYEKIDEKLQPWFVVFNQLKSLNVNKEDVYLKDHIKAKQRLISDIEKAALELGKIFKEVEYTSIVNIQESVVESKKNKANEQIECYQEKVKVMWISEKENLNKLIETKHLLTEWFSKKDSLDLKLNQLFQQVENVENIDQARQFFFKISDEFDQLRNDFSTMREDLPSRNLVDLERIMMFIDVRLKGVDMLLFTADEAENFVSSEIKNMEDILAKCSLLPSNNYLSVDDVKCAINEYQLNVLKIKEICQENSEDCMYETELFEFNEIKEKISICEEYLQGYSKSFDVTVSLFDDVREKLRQLLDNTNQLKIIDISQGTSVENVNGALTTQKCKAEELTNLLTMTSSEVVDLKLRLPVSECNQLESQFVECTEKLNSIEQNATKINGILEHVKVQWKLLNKNHRSIQSWLKVSQKAVLSKNQKAACIEDWLCESIEFEDDLLEQQSNIEDLSESFQCLIQSLPFEEQQVVIANCSDLKQSFNELECLFKNSRQELEDNINQRDGMKLAIEQLSVDIKEMKYKQERINCDEDMFLKNNVLTEYTCIYVKLLSKCDTLRKLLESLQLCIPAIEWNTLSTSLNMEQVYLAAMKGWLENYSVALEDDQTKQKNIESMLMGVKERTEGEINQLQEIISGGEINQLQDIISGEEISQLQDIISGSSLLESVSSFLYDFDHQISTSEDTLMNIKSQVNDESLLFLLQQCMDLLENEKVLMQTIKIKTNNAELFKVELVTVSNMFHLFTTDNDIEKFEVLNDRKKKNSVLLKKLMKLKTDIESIDMLQQHKEHYIDMLNQLENKMKTLEADINIILNKNSESMLNDLNDLNTILVNNIADIKHFFKNLDDRLNICKTLQEKTQTIIETIDMYKHQKLQTGVHIMNSYKVLAIEHLSETDGCKRLEMNVILLQEQVSEGEVNLMKMLDATTKLERTVTELAGDIEKLYVNVQEYEANVTKSWDAYSLAQLCNKFNVSMIELQKFSGGCRIIQSEMNILNEIPQWQNKLIEKDFAVLSEKVEENLNICKEKKELLTSFVTLVNDLPRSNIIDISDDIEHHTNKEGLLLPQMKFFRSKLKNEFDVISKHYFTLNCLLDRFLPSEKAKLMSFLDVEHAFNYLKQLKSNITQLLQKIDEFENRHLENQNKNERVNRKNAVSSTDDVILNQSHIDDVILNQSHIDDVILNQSHIDDVILDQSHIDDVILEQSHIDDIILNQLHTNDEILDRSWSEYCEYIKAGNGTSEDLIPENIQDHYVRDINLIPEGLAFNIELKHIAKENSVIHVQDVNSLEDDLIRPAPTTDLSKDIKSAVIENSNEPHIQVVSPLPDDMISLDSTPDLISDTAFIVKDRDINSLLELSTE